MVGAAGRKGVLESALGIQGAAGSGSSHSYPGNGKCSLGTVYAQLVTFLFM